MFHCDRFALWDVHLLRKNLGEPVDEHRLSGCLFVNRFDDRVGKGLPYFVCVLGKEFADLFKCEVRQFKLVLDIKRRDRTIVVELRDALDTNDTDAVGASISTREVDVAE